MCVQCFLVDYAGGLIDDMLNLWVWHLLLTLAACSLEHVCRVLAHFGSLHRYFLALPHSQRFAMAYHLLEHVGFEFLLLGDRLVL